MSIATCSRNQDTQINEIVSVEHANKKVGLNAESVLVSDARASNVTLNNNGSEVAIDVSVLEYFSVLFAGKDASVVLMN
jgi:DNA polymerase sigma